MMTTTRLAPEKRQESLHPRRLIFNAFVSSETPWDRNHFCPEALFTGVSVSCSSRLANPFVCRSRFLLSMPPGSRTNSPRTFCHQFWCAFKLNKLYRNRDNERKMLQPSIICITLENASARLYHLDIIYLAKLRCCRQWSVRWGSKALFCLRPTLKSMN